MHEQQTLFAMPEMNPRHPRFKDWERLAPASAGKIHQVWHHVPTGVLVLHCGHPTAHRPWYIAVDEEDAALVAWVDALAPDESYDFRRPQKHLESILATAEHHLAELYR